MDQFDGIWRLTESRAWDEHGNRLPAPYGEHPQGHISFNNGRMLVALCNGDSDLSDQTARGYSSYGGRYTFDGKTLTVMVDMASDPSRIGGQQTRGVEIIDEHQILLLPPARSYGGAAQRREILWERVWPRTAT